MKPFIKAHILRVVSNYHEDIINSESFLRAYKLPPFDYYIKKYLNKNKENFEDFDFLTIINYSFRLFRYKELIDHAFKTTEWADRLEILEKHKDRELYDSPKIKTLPLYAQCSCPPSLFSLLSKELTEKQAFKLCYDMLIKKDPLTICVNNSKVSRENLMSILQKKYNIICKKTCYSAHGLQMIENTQNLSKMPFFKTKEFHQGYYFKQNEACQLSLAKLKINPGSKILDYSARLGEKSLNLAFTHKDLSFTIFEERENFFNACKKNFERISINAKLIANKDEMEKLQEKFDFVLFDAPCTDTGMLKEKPEGKLKFSLLGLNDLIILQSKLLEKASKYLKPSTGKLIYFTNSLLREENIEVIQKFCKKKNMSLDDEEFFQSFPDEEGLYGHFSCILKQN